PFHLGLYIALFPQLIAGPIVRFHDISLQIIEREIGYEKFAAGVKRFIRGLSKKILIANAMAIIADDAFSISTEELSTVAAWLGIVCYSLQIYFDFSGYSDMAIGLGKMFGFDFLENFNYPYISKSIQEFWRRWHISLSTWFRDYLYIPLGGNRGSHLQTYSNLIVIFFVTGLWHGASWNFIIWGLF
ncbi:MBOAT family O-acyltransferase, partial [Xanthovirga aplysinae]|uniref:MBOAT family O-acyltransferase n=1 Tax=Xanthovirga aplysinae TaxID=2529853 RepID=UPI001656A10C